MGEVEGIQHLNESLFVANVVNLSFVGDETCLMDTALFELCHLKYLGHL